MVNLIINNSNFESKETFTSVKKAEDYVETLLEAEKKKIGNELYSVSHSKWFKHQNKHYRSVTLAHKSGIDEKINITIEES